ncbi:uncharacterized protein TNCV_939181 [Trichonephila clavipes]|nr:uncharacterized protein TNCV_939181 [Trichonephila clavipes]
MPSIGGYHPYGLASILTGLEFNKALWDMLGRRIAARQPPPTCLSELRRTLLDEWCNFPQDQIDNLIFSMPRRCKACIASSGDILRARQIPVHEWYEGNCPVATLLGTDSRLDETTLTRLRSGHTGTQRHVSPSTVCLPSLSELQCEPSRSCPHHGLYWLPYEPTALKSFYSPSLLKKARVHGLDLYVSTDQVG